MTVGAAFVLICQSPSLVNCLDMARRDPKTEWIRVAGYRTMTPQPRLRIAEELTKHGRWIAFNMARKNSNRSAREIEIELWDRIYGRAVAARVSGLQRRWHLEEAARPPEE